MVNSPQTELASAIDDEQTTIPLLDASKLPPAPNLATIGTDETAETVLYTGKSGNNLTGVTRGFQGAAKAWVQGTKVARLFTEYDYEALADNIRDLAGGIDDLAGEGRTTETVKGNADALAAHLADYAKDVAPVFNVKGFGAVGDGVADDTTAILAAIAAVPDDGGIVYFPAGTYIISSTLNIGDGSTTQRSTKNGIRLVGEGECYILAGSLFFNDNPISGTRLLWQGAVGGTMIKVNGPIFGFGMENIFLDCNRNARAGIALQLISASNGYFKNVKAVSYSSIGLDMNVQPVASINGEANGISSANNVFENLQLYNPDTSTTALKLDGFRDANGHNCTQNIFRGLDYGIFGTNSKGIHLGFCDFNRFENVVGVVYGSASGSYGVYLDGAGTMPFLAPDNNVFYQCALGQNIGIGFTGTPGDNFFYDYSTDDSSIIPSGEVTTYAHGITIPGRTRFGKFLTPEFTQISLSSPYSLRSNASNNVAVDGILDLGSVFGVFLVVRDSSSGAYGVFFVTNVGTSIVFQPGTTFSTTKDTAGKINVYYESGSAKIQNKTAASLNLNIIGFRLG